MPIGHQKWKIPHLSSCDIAVKAQVQEKYCVELPPSVCGVYEMQTKLVCLVLGSVCGISHCVLTNNLITHTLKKKKKSEI